MLPEAKKSFFKEMARGSVNYALGSYVVKAMVFLNTAIILAATELYSYGVYKLAFSIYVATTGLLLPGLSGLVLNDAIDYSAKQQEDKAVRLLREFISLRLVIGLFMFLFFYLFSDFLASYYGISAAGYLKIISWLFLTSTVITISETLLSFKADFLGPASMSVVGEIVKFLGLIYFYKLAPVRLNTSILLIISVVGSAATALYIFAYFFYRHGLNFLRKTQSISSPLWAIVRAHGKWGLMKNFSSSMVDSIRLWLVKLFVSTEALAVYSVASSLAAAVKKLVPTQTISILVPRHILDRKELVSIYARASKYFIWLFFVTIVVSWFVVPFLVSIVFPKYVTSLPYFKILVFALIFNGMALNKQIIYSLKKQKVLFVFSIIEFVSTVLFGAILISRWGIAGATAEFLITEFLIFYITLRYLYFIRPELRFTFRTLFTLDKQDISLLSKLWHAIKYRLVTNWLK